MSYFILMGRRIPKQAITGFRFQNETDNIRPFLSIRIRGKEEIIPLKDKREILSVKAHLCSVFSEFVKIGDWYLKMSEVKEYKPVTAEDMNPYILFKTSKFGNIKVRFPKDEDMNAEFENMALLNIEDYNELKAKAEATDEQIKKQAEEMAKPEVVTLKVRFYTYGVSYNPYTCVDVEIPFYDDKKIRDMLNKASADIMKWCDKNMEKYNKELKESRSTKKNIAKG